MLGGRAEMGLRGALTVVSRRESMHSMHGMKGHVVADSDFDRRWLPGPAPVMTVSYRFPPEIHHLVELAVQHAARSGDRLSRNEAVIKAIRATYGHLST